MTSNSNVEIEDLMDDLQDMPDHPRLLVPADEIGNIKKRIDQSPLLEEYANILLSDANQLLSIDPVQRKKVGRRMHGASRKCLRRVLTLGLAFRMSGRDAFSQRLEQEMMSGATFVDWNPSHFLDSAEMAAALAVGYDWIHDTMSPANRETIRKTIINKGLKPSFDDDYNWWLEVKHNWNQVCNGSLVLAALVACEEDAELAARVIARAVDAVPLAMDHYGPNGAYSEGPGYWRYGTSFNVLMIEGLRTALGTDYGLGQHDNFLRSGWYYLNAHGSTGRYFNYSDCGSWGSPAGFAPPMFWFARELGRPDLLWMERRKLKRLLNEKKHSTNSESGVGGRLMPLILHWSPPLDDISPPEDTDYCDRGNNPVCMHRTGWESDDAYVGLKAGSPQLNHGHMDIGTFVLDMGGRRWALDFGSESYHNLETADVDLWNMEQHSERWDIFRYGNQGHNTLMVDDQKQKVDGTATIERFDPDNHSSTIDMTPVYEGQLASARRSIELCGNETMVVEDELRAPERNVTVRWAMITEADVELIDDIVNLSLGDQNLSVHAKAPESVEWQTLPTDPPTKHEADNEGTQMLAFSLGIPAEEEVNVRVEFRG